MRNSLSNKTEHIGCLKCLTQTPRLSAASSAVRQLRFRAHLCLPIRRALLRIQRNRLGTSILRNKVRPGRWESMNIPSRFLTRQIARVLVILSAVPFARADCAPSQEVPSSQQPQDSGSQPKKQSTDTNRADAAYPDSPNPARPQSADQTGQSAPLPAISQQPQNDPQKPVGTAVAPYEKSTGVAASRPAGAVIAPAKQRRARSFVIRVAVVVGAAAAIGTVVALSHASPGRP